MILGPNGKPVSTSRKVTLQIRITDTKPGASDTDLRTLNFLLDVPDRKLVGQLLDQVKIGVMRQLDAINFWSPQAAGGSIGSAEAPNVPVS